jgi:pyridoxine 4-dehydrogenase
MEAVDDQKAETNAMMQSDTTSVGGADLLLGGDLPVDRLGFGTMRLTGPGNWGYPPDPENARAVLRHAVERGVRLIDTADAYGPSVAEELIEQALRPYPDDLVVTTKGGLSRQGPNRYAALGRPEYLIQCAELSLRRLRLDVLPLYQLHRVDPAVPLEDSLGALVELKEAGKIRHIGLSAVTLDQVRRAQELTPIASVQNLYNIADRSSDDVVDFCESEGIAFMPWFPLAMGSLAADEGLIATVAARHGATASQVSLAWLLARSATMVPIPGTSSIEHLQENLAARELRLTAQDITELTAATIAPAG